MSSLTGIKSQNCNVFLMQAVSRCPPLRVDGRGQNLPVGDIFNNAAHVRAKGGQFILAEGKKIDRDAVVSKAMRGY